MGHDPYQDGDIQIRTWIRSIGSVDLGILVAEMYHQRVGIWLDTYDLLLYPAGPPPRGEQPVGSRAALLVSTLVPSDDEIPSMGHDPRWDHPWGRVGAQHVHVLTQYLHTGPTLCGEQAVLW